MNDKVKKPAAKKQREVTNIMGAMSYYGLLEIMGGETVTLSDDVLKDADSMLRIEKAIESGLLAEV